MKDTGQDVNRMILAGEKWRNLRTFSIDSNGGFLGCYYALEPLIMSTVFENSESERALRSIKAKRIPTFQDTIFT